MNLPEVTASLPNAEWPYLQILVRLALSLALGLLIGLERERRGKEAGLRTFGFVCLLGALGGSLGDAPSRPPSERHVQGHADPCVLLALQRCIDKQPVELRPQRCGPPRP